MLDHTQRHDAASFAELRRRSRRFIAAGLSFVIGWFMLLVVAAGWAPQALAKPVLGNVNVGMLLLLSQFVAALVVTQLYLRYARTRLDPLSDSLEDPS
jgi:uncharacterized membrane protein (DUF485 family)